MKQLSNISGELYRVLIQNVLNAIVGTIGLFVLTGCTSEPFMTGNQRYENFRLNRFAAQQIEVFQQDKTYDSRRGVVLGILSVKDGKFELLYRRQSMSVFNSLNDVVRSGANICATADEERWSRISFVFVHASSSSLRASFFDCFDVDDLRRSEAESATKSKRIIELIEREMGNREKGLEVLNTQLKTLIDQIDQINRTQ